MAYTFDPAHNFWIVDWVVGATKYQAREFTDYAKAAELFQQLKQYPDLGPVLEGFTH